MSATSDIVDLAIIGGGPVGLFGAFYAGMRQMSVRIIDSLDILGGQLMTLYPEKYIYDAPGFPRILAKDLSANLVKQGLQFGATTHLGEQVRQLLFDSHTRLYTIVTAKAAHVCRAILVAAGVGAFQPKTLPLANASEYEGNGLEYFVRHLSDYADKHVLIIGGGDSAVDWANALCGSAASVTLIHRRDQFRAHEESVTRREARYVS